MILPVILSGGNGTRLWPLSRKDKPKQFINLFGNESLFLKTINRFSNQDLFKTPLVVGNINHLNLIENELLQCSRLNAKNPTIILEPNIRNTAPAIASVLEYLYKNSMEDEVVVFTPSDAYIDNIQKFQEYLLVGEKIANRNLVVLFGIEPTYPETGYGYVSYSIDDGSVNDFKEKPNLSTANSFIKSGNYLWNAGIFMAKVSVLRQLFIELQKKLYLNIVDCINKSAVKNNILYLDEETFNNSENISMDYAIIEKVDRKNLAIIPMEIGWSDLGNFKAIHSINEHDINDNVIDGKAIVNNVNNCFIRSNKKLICCCDVSNLVVVEDENAILVMDINKSQRIKEVVERMKNCNLKEFL